MTTPARPLVRTASLLALVLATACGAPSNESAGPPNGGDSVDPLAALDTVPPAPAAEADTVPVGSYYVHLVAGADPVAIAARYGVVATDTIEGARPGFVAPLTLSQMAALEADSSVRSLARELHPGGAEAPPIRVLGGKDSTGS